jgi:signal transduction histidine kinase
MKLLTESTRRQALLFLILLAFAVSAIYLILERERTDEADEQLALNSSRIKDFVVKNDSISPAVLSLIQLRLEVANPVDSLRESTYADFSFFDHGGEMEHFHGLTFPLKLRGQWHLATVYQLSVEPEDILGPLAVSIGFTLFLLLLGILFLGRWRERQLWAPFYKTISEIKNYTPGLSTGKVELAKTRIEEFDDLNTAITRMLDTIAADFGRLKAFTENAAHEMRTPLAVLRIELQNLLQLESISERVTEHVRGALFAEKRISTLMETLLLLAKIENQQYKASTPLLVAPILREQLDLYADHFEAKGIVIDVSAEPDAAVVMHPALLELLVGNLFRNVLRHSTKGIVSVTISTSELVVENFGPDPGMPTEQLFERFRKADGTSGGLGLGLSIIKAIADSHQMKVRYSYEAGKHTVSLQF